MTGDKIANEAEMFIESMVQSIESPIRVNARCSSGIIDVTMYGVGMKRAFLVVTMEALIDAKVDPSQMRDAFRTIIKNMSPNPTSVFLITSVGLREITLEGGWGTLEEPDGWHWFEDEAALVEGDKIAEHFFSIYGRG